MRRRSSALNTRRAAAMLIRRRIELGGERLWRHSDFRDLPAQAVAQALSRAAKEGRLERLSKGLYYRSRQTALGPSRPNPSTIQNLACRERSVFAAGLSAANLLGFSTRASGRRELATTAASLPRKLVGADAIITTRRPESWNRLSETEAALLDLLRGRAATSELSSDETTCRMLSLLSQENRFERLLKAAGTEPPRVRAMLGALGEQSGRSGSELKRLRDSLNPLSRFDFGALSGLKHARDWQAKE